MTMRMIPQLAWPAVACLSLACACFRLLAGSATAYTLCYAALCAFGIVAAVVTLAQRGSHASNGITLLIPALGALFLLFVDLTSLARVLCLVVIALAAISATIELRRRTGDVG